MLFEESKVKNLLDLDKTIAKELLEKYTYPWEALKDISQFILEISKNLDKNEYYMLENDILVHKSVVIPQNAIIKGPAIICEAAQVRSSCFIRGGVIIGKEAVAGNSCEFKNCILFDKVQTPHYNYIGDSILGYKSHMGASSLTSNVKSDKSLVTLKFKDKNIDTMLKKFGAIVGDYVEVGCGSVLNPGTIIGRNTNIYPLSSVRGSVDANSIYKNKDEIVKKY